MVEIRNPGKTCGMCGHFVPSHWDPVWGSCMAPCFGGDPPDPEYPDSPDAETCILFSEDGDETP